MDYGYLLGDFRHGVFRYRNADDPDKDQPVIEVKNKDGHSLVALRSKSGIPTPASPLSAAMSVVLGTKHYLSTNENRKSQSWKEGTTACGPPWMSRPQRIQTAVTWKFDANDDNTVQAWLNNGERIWRWIVADTKDKKAIRQANQWIRDHTYLYSSVKQGEDPADWYKKHSPYGHNEFVLTSLANFYDVKENAVVPADHLETRSGETVEGWFMDKRGHMNTMYFISAPTTETYDRSDYAKHFREYSPVRSQVYVLDRWKKNPGPYASWQSGGTQYPAAEDSIINKESMDTAADWDGVTPKKVNVDSDAGGFLGLGIGGARSFTDYHGNSDALHPWILDLMTVHNHIPDIPDTDEDYAPISTPPRYGFTLERTHINVLKWCDKFKGRKPKDKTNNNESEWAVEVSKAVNKAHIRGPDVYKLDVSRSDNVWAYLDPDGHESIGAQLPIVTSSPFFWSSVKHWDKILTDLDLDFLPYVVKKDVKYRGINYSFWKDFHSTRFAHSRNPVFKCRYTTVLDVKMPDILSYVNTMQNYDTDEYDLLEWVSRHYPDTWHGYKEVHSASPIFASNYIVRRNCATGMDLEWAPDTIDGFDERPFKDVEKVSMAGRRKMHRTSLMGKNRNGVRAFHLTFSQENKADMREFVMGGPFTQTSTHDYIPDVWMANVAEFSRYLAAGQDGYFDATAQDVMHIYAGTPATHSWLTKILISDKLSDMNFPILALRSLSTHQMTSDALNIPMRYMANHKSELLQVGWDKIEAYIEDDPYLIRRYMTVRTLLLKDAKKGVVTFGAVIGEAITQKANMYKQKAIDYLENLVAEVLPSVKKFTETLDNAAIAITGAFDKTFKSRGEGIQKAIHLNCLRTRATYAQLARDEVAQEEVVEGAVIEREAASLEEELVDSYRVMEEASIKMYGLQATRNSINELNVAIAMGAEDVSTPWGFLVNTAVFALTWGITSMSAQAKKQEAEEKRKQHLIREKIRQMNRDDKTRSEFTEPVTLNRVLWESHKFDSTPASMNNWTLPLNKVLELIVTNNMSLDMISNEWLTSNEGMSQYLIRSAEFVREMRVIDYYMQDSSDLHFVTENDNGLFIDQKPWPIKPNDMDTFDVDAMTPIPCVAYFAEYKSRKGEARNAWVQSFTERFGVAFEGTETKSKSEKTGRVTVKRSYDAPVYVGFEKSTTGFVSALHPDIEWPTVARKGGRKLGAPPSSPVSKSFYQRSNVLDGGVLPKNVSPVYIHNDDNLVSVIGESSTSTKTAFRNTGDMPLTVLVYNANGSYNMAQSIFPQTSSNIPVDPPFTMVVVIGSVAKSLEEAQPDPMSISSMVRSLVFKVERHYHFRGMVLPGRKKCKMTQKLIQLEKLMSVTHHAFLLELLSELKNDFVATNASQCHLIDFLSSQIHHDRSHVSPVSPIEQRALLFTYYYSVKFPNHKTPYPRLYSLFRNANENSPIVKKTGRKWKVVPKTGSLSIATTRLPTVSGVKRSINVSKSSIDVTGDFKPGVLYGDGQLLDSASKLTNFILSEGRTVFPGVKREVEEASDRIFPIPPVDPSILYIARAIINDETTAFDHDVNQTGFLLACERIRLARIDIASTARVVRLIEGSEGRMRELLELRKQYVYKLSSDASDAERLMAKMLIHDHSDDIIDPNTLTRWVHEAPLEGISVYANASKNSLGGSSTIAFVLHDRTDESSRRVLANLYFRHGYFDGLPRDGVVSHVATQILSLVSSNASYKFVIVSGGSSCPGAIDAIRVIESEQLGGNLSGVHLFNPHIGFQDVNVQANNDGKVDISVYKTLGADIHPRTDDPFSSLVGGYPVVVGFKTVNSGLATSGMESFNSSRVSTDSHDKRILNDRNDDFHSVQVRPILPPRLPDVDTLKDVKPNPPPPKTIVKPPVKLPSKPDPKPPTEPKLPKKRTQEIPPPIPAPKRPHIAMDSAPIHFQW